jgi:hypothetical protein
VYKPVLKRKNLVVRLQMPERALPKCNSKGAVHGQVLPGLATGGAGNCAGADLFLHALIASRAMLNRDAGRFCAPANFFFSDIEQPSKRAVN